MLLWTLHQQIKYNNQEHVHVVLFGGVTQLRDSLVIHNTDAMAFAVLPTECDVACELQSTVEHLITLFCLV